MSSKIGLNFIKHYSINFSLPKRDNKFIKFIIIHYTGMRKENDAIKRLCSLNSKVSAHYFIRNNGKILNLVPDLFEAWHAGKSRWGKYSMLNKFSIGVEIQNPGHDHGYKKFNNNQISSLKKLLKYLTKKYKINKKNILGHSDIAPNRKKDPGEKFPWKELAKKNLVTWYNINEKEIKKFRKEKISSKNENIFIKNLNKFGYARYYKRDIVKAFQRKFRQNLVDGKIDKECFIISKNLLKQ